MQVFLLGLAGFFAAILARGQTIAEDEIRWGARPYAPRAENAIRVQTNMVEVGVVVRDSHGKTVGGLTQADFEVLDNGKPQKTTFFSVENAPPRLAVAPVAPPSADDPTPPPAPVAKPKPRYIAFYFDDFSMPEGDLAFSRRAAEQFIREHLQPGDLIGIYTSSTFVSIEFTDAHEKLLATLGHLVSHLRRADQGPMSCPRMNVYQAWLINQNWNTHSDAFDLALAEAKACGCISHCDTQVRAQAQETQALAEHSSQDTIGVLDDVINHLERMPGRKMLVLASSGFFTLTIRQKQEKLVDDALRAGVVINSLDAKGLYAETPGGDLSEGPLPVTQGDLMALHDRFDHQQKEYFNDPMAILAEGTGGKFFHNSNDLGRGLREMAALPEVSYVLGFSPEDLKQNGAYHNLRVKIADKREVTIEARRGYYAPRANAPVAVPSASALRSQSLDRAVRSSDLPSDISATMSAETSELDSGSAALRVAIHVDIRNLPFQRQTDRSVERLIFVTALFDQQDHFLSGVQGIMDLNLKDATLTRLNTQGLDAKLSLQAPPGSYRLRQVVQEEGSGRIAAFNTQVEIH
jgi:VWFA-related protein